MRLKEGNLGFHCLELQKCLVSQDPGKTGRIGGQPCLAQIQPEDEPVLSGNCGILSIRRKCLQFLLACQLHQQDAVSAHTMTTKTTITTIENTSRIMLTFEVPRIVR